MPHTPEGFEWEVPAIVLHIISGHSFMADLDLGWNAHMHSRVIVEKLLINEDREMDARKYAQKLLTGAQVTLRSRRLQGTWTIAEVAYGPLHVPRSEQGSFTAAMLAAGLATLAEE
jgi:hypothetical protein